MAKTTKDFYAVRPGQVYPEVIPAGSEVEGRIADIAAQIGALEVVETPAIKRTTKAVKAAPETK